MSKIAVVGDAHFGVRGGDPQFLDFMVKWWSELIHTCYIGGVKKIVQVGDFMDNRKVIDARVAWRIKHEVVPLLEQCDIQMDILLGNHNIYYRDSNEIHNMTFMDSPNIRIINEHLEEGDFLYLAWINKNNMEQQLQAVKNSKARFCFGHLELEDFAMYKGIMATHGMDPELFKKFETVLTGHYHTVSAVGNICYIGSPYHLTFADYPDGIDRGWFLLDTETGEYELRRNREDQTLFAVVEYDPEHKYLPADIKPYEGKIVRFVVKEKGDTKRYNKFLEAIKEVKFIEYKILDESIAVKKPNTQELSAAQLITNTASVLVDYAVELAGSTTVDPERMKRRVLDVHERATNK